MNKFIDTLKNKDNWFEWLLVFIGVRRYPNQREYQGDKDLRSQFRQLVTRQLVRNKSRRQVGGDNVSQPRHIIRNMYRDLYNADLSPEKPRVTPSVSGRSTVSDEPDDLEGGVEDVKLNIRMVMKNRILDRMDDDPVGVGLSWVYSIFIFLVLSVRVGYNIYFISIEGSQKTNFYWASLFFNLIPPTQYVLSWIYFRTSHFEDTYMKSNNCCFPSMNTFTVIIVMVSISISIFNQVILVTDTKLQQNDSEFPGYNNLDLQWLVLCYLWIVWIYGNFIVYTNLIVFSLVFCKHCRVITDYVKKLEMNTNLDTLTLNIITKEILGIRYGLEDSIDLLKGIFSMFTLIGAVGFGFFIERIKDGNFSLFPWHQFIPYIITQIVFIFIIVRVSKNKDNLSDYIRQPIFIDKFLKRYNKFEIKQKFGDNLEMIILNMEEENASTMDWIVLNDLFNEEWTEFKVMGFEISDGSLLKKGLVIVTLIITFTNLMN